MEERTRETWVIGHKNPDTDSICSAICYANLKNKRDGSHFVAKKAGKVNLETDYVLKYFGVDEPDMVYSVGPQICDVDYRRDEGVSPDLSLKKAWDLMKERSAQTLPVLKKKKLAGVITLQDITKAYMEVDPKILGQAHTSVKNILETIDGKLLVGDSKAEAPSGKLAIAAAAPEQMEAYIEENDIVIMANRYEAQVCAIQMGAGMIIACLGATISPAIKKMAEEKNCAIVTTKNDTFTVARLINQSMPVSHFMTTEGLVTFRTTDAVETAHEIMAKLRHRYFPVLDHQGNYMGMLSRRNILGMKRKQIILVDHNESSQTCDGMEEAEVLEIIDHHRLGTISTISPIYFRNQPVGCTATIIYQMYEEEKIPVDKTIAGLLCSAIISDTLLFRSPTCTDYDRAAARKLAVIAGINLERFAHDMFTAGSDVSSKSAESIFHQDFKEFGMGEYTVGIGQINSMSHEELSAIKDKLVKYMPTALKKHGLHMTFFMLTSIMDESTEVLYCGEGAEAAVRAAFGEPVDGGVTVSGMVSRKKQMVPALTQVLQDNN